MKILRQYDFEPGKRIYSQQIDDEFNNLVDAHNNQDDEFISHYGKQADETSSNAIKDKHVSNKQLKDIYDYIELSNVEIQVNKNSIGVESSRNDQQDSDIQGIVGAFLQDQKVVALRDSNDGKVYMLNLRDGALDTIPIGTISNNIVTIDYSSLVATSSFLTYQQQVTTALSLKADKTYTDTELAKDRTRLTTLESNVATVTSRLNDTSFTPTLLNGWAVKNAMSCKLEDNRVTLALSLQKTTLVTSAIFAEIICTLDAAYRPNGVRIGTGNIYAEGSAVGSLYCAVETNGNVTLRGNGLNNSASEYNIHMTFFLD